MIESGSAAPDLSSVRTAAGLVEALDRLRRQAARGSGRARVTLIELSAATGVPRSTLHAYLQGARLPPADVLDSIVLELGADAHAQAQWAGALERVHDADAPRSPGDPAVVTVRPAGQEPRQLPAAPEHFLGRASELARLDEVLAEGRPGARVIAVSGAGGVGKTALVLRWAWSAVHAFPDGQLWVDLRGFSAGPALRPEDALERLLRAVGVGTAELPADLEVRAALFRSAVSGRRMLLVLDNAQDSAQVRALLPASPGFVTVITSRDTLRSLVATVGATRIGVPRLSADDALAVLSADLPSDVVAVLRAGRAVEQCDGLPLALRIVRERVSEVTSQEATEVVQELGRGRRERLTALDLNDSSTQVSVAGVLQMSYDALGAEAARVFRRLGLCLVSTFETHVVAALADRDVAATRRILDTLVSANLLDRAGTGAYRAHDLVAAFAEEQLDAQEGAGAIDEARARLTEYIGRSASAAIVCLDPVREFRIPWAAASTVPAAPVVGAEGFDDPVAALRWITANDDLLVALVDDLLTSDLRDSTFPMIECAWRARYPLGDLSGLEPALIRGAQLAEAMSEPRVSMSLRRMLGITYGRASRWQEATDTFELSRALAVELGDLTMAAIDRSNIGTVLAMSGRLDEAQEQYELSLSELTAAGEDVTMTSPTLTGLAELALERGDVPAAQGWVERALMTVSGSVPLSFTDQEVHVIAARCDLESGRLEALRERLAHLGQVSLTTGNGHLFTRTRTVASALHRAEGDVASAERAALEGAEAARAFGVLHMELEARAELGTALLLGGRTDEARKVLREATELARSAQLPYRECDLAIRLAEVAVAVADEPDLVGRAGQAAAIAGRCGYRALGERARALADSAGHLPA